MASKTFSRTILSPEFFQRRTKTVAQDLLGKVLCRRWNSGEVFRGRIVETEAYLGLTDSSCHSFGPNRSSRTEVMFMKGGVFYVYLIYGVYHCLNVVTEIAEKPEAVLIRALEPLDIGLHKSSQSFRGPGLLCKILEIDKGFNGKSVEGGELWIEEGEKVSRSEIVVGPRIGINTKKDSCDWPLRYGVKSSSFLSRPFRV